MKIPPSMQAWIDARKRHHLSDAQVQMARELGMNPQKLSKLDNHKQEPWKAPLPDFIESCYLKRFGKERPDQIRSIERAVREQSQKKAKSKARKQQARHAIATGEAGLIKKDLDHGL